MKKFVAILILMLIFVLGIIGNSNAMYQENSLDDLIIRIENSLGKQHQSLIKLKSNNSVIIKKELKELMKYVSEGDKKLSELGIIATKLFLEYDQMPKKQLQKKANEYFQGLGGISISFKDKLSGDQLGNRIYVKYKDGQEITYHAKTHRGGLKSQHSSSTSPVDLKELIAYKILEYFEVGAETHFFYDDIKNFYIATKDVGYNSIKRTQEEFLTYEKIRDKASTEELLKDQKIVNGFIKTDILSRLLLLSDVLNNGGNTGISPDGSFKVIDFNPPVTKEYKNPKIFEDWLSGNNQYNYSDQTIISILKKQDHNTKIKEALQIIKELQNFELFVNTAYKDIFKIATNFDAQEIQLQDLKFYVDSIIYNHKILSSKILE